MHTVDTVGYSREAPNDRRRPVPTETSSPSTAAPVDTHAHPAVAALDVEPLSALLEAHGVMLVLKDPASGRYQHVSGAFAAGCGQSREAFVGRTDTQNFDGSTATALRAADAVAVEAGRAVTSEQAIPWQGMRANLLATRMALPVSSGGSVAATLWSDRRELDALRGELRQAKTQIAQQQQIIAGLRRDLAEAVPTEFPSELGPRARFDEQLRREVDLSVREHREFAIVFIALDPPAAGTLDGGAADVVRDTVGHLLRSGTRAMDASCRWDEGRFAVLLSGVGLATAHSRMEGLRRQCATQIVMHGGLEHRFTVAMGVASYPHTADDVESLLLAAQSALSEARRRGGNQVTLASIRLDLGSAR